MKKILIFSLNFYRKYISHLKGGASCRFYPTCSEYSLKAIEKYGAAKGILLSIRRILRCHPLSKGGYDPVP